MFGEHLQDSGCDIDWVLGHDRVHNAVVMMDGCDHYTAAQAPQKGWSGAASSMPAGRFGGQAITPSGAFVKTLPASYSTLIFGFAFKPTASGANEYANLRASGTNVARVFTSASNFLQVQNSGGTVIATGTTALSTGVWYYVEVKIVVNGASGTCELHLNGAAEIAQTTGNFGSSNINEVRLNQAVAYDDLYCVDTTGSAPRNTFLGDVRVATLTPTSDGAHTDWTPSTGSNHFANVDETTPNDDTDYNSDSTVGHIDTFGFSDVDTGATVYGVQTNIWARKDDAATRQLAALIRQASTDYVGNTLTLASTYTFYSQLYNQDPTSADWTAANVNADEFGVKTIA